MLHITTLQLGQLDSNCYLATNANNQTLIIDPGYDGDFITEEILKRKLKPIAIILTHAHFDHCLGIFPLKLNFATSPAPKKQKSNFPIILHSKDLFLYKQANKSSQHWTGIPGDPLPPPDILLKSNSTAPKKILDLFNLQIIETPGHTPGSISLHHASRSDLEVPLLFSGDTLFKDGVGRTDFSYSNPQDLHDSLQKLKKLPPQTIIYPGHGETTTIKTEFN